jgi:hypothetical protein
MWVWRPTDGDGVKLFVEPHVEMLAQEWEPRDSRDPTKGRRRRTPRHHHHLHLRLHAAH